MGVGGEDEVVVKKSMGGDMFVRGLWWAEFESGLLLWACFGPGWN